MAPPEATMGQPALGELSNAYLAYQEDARQAVSRARRAALDCSDTDTAEGKSGAPSYSRPRSAGGIALRPAVYTPRPELSEPAPAAPQWRPAPGAPVRPVQAAASWCPAPVAHNQALSAYKQALQSGPPPPPQRVCGWYHGASGAPRAVGLQAGGPTAPPAPW